MQPRGIVLFNSSFIGSSVGTVQQWTGGRTVLTVSATQYGPNGVIPQVQNLNGSWIPICSSIVADQLFSFDAPGGSFRLISNLGSSIGVAATFTGA